ncbi:MAG: LysR family transcriptional regulator [Campylobacteraceae bacterium]|jgi:DNA-binding transcriptional LysR family regulator|nr:LysR family transcriptional regulator [Campylobacteraceae bacterium]MBT3882086.1 LysR family transcriptional regulator [Campylobacteraceae bacterium]MBT4029921.1 LysR family transcriptional regulator [Campylobacteraceae bacterium]MBT4178859.1 LysR family transcriptional regulator [Campylobacteraceae bacterium]MBT4572154.1 LysR family transcriptional regulator [Campylobacteraceae bacterium]
MLSDFTKVNTFLTVVAEKSFSKASSKLGISQPAVTQQMRFIEDYLDFKIVERRKNGIRLTKEGEAFYNIVSKLSKCVANAEKSVLALIDKEIIFKFSTSYVVGNYILPIFLNDIKASIDNDVSIDVSTSADALQKLLDKKTDMALIDVMGDTTDIMYREWMEDEIVIFSNQPLPKKLKANDLLSYKWVCRDRESNTRDIFKDALDSADLPDCDNFNMVSESSSVTTIIQTVLKSNKDDVPTVSIVSHHAISDYVNNGMLYEARLNGAEIRRKLYIAYLKERKYDAFVDTVIDYLLGIKVK